MVKTLEDNFAPYAPVRAVIDVIARFRERGLPEPITTNALEQVGISSTMVSLTLRALVFLGLMDESGNRMEAFERLRRASTEEYQKILEEIVRKAYLPVFTVVDPAQDDDIKVTDAFRRYDPANQRQKMVRLFIGLCQEAGIVERQTTRVRTLVKQKRLPRKKETMRTAASQSEQTAMQETGKPASITSNIGADYRLISAIIQHLPNEGHWNAEERKRWLDAMTASVDLLIKTDDN